MAGLVERKLSRESALKGAVFIGDIGIEAVGNAGFVFQAAIAGSTHASSIGLRSSGRSLRPPFPSGWHCRCSNGDGGGGQDGFQIESSVEANLL